jgi:hypothetical protein
MTCHPDLHPIPSDASCAASASARALAGNAYFYGYWFSHRRA